jgi:hypothetical protein
VEGLRRESEAARDEENDRLRSVLLVLPFSLSVFYWGLSQICCYCYRRWLLYYFDCALSFSSAVGEMRPPCGKRNA